MRDRSERSGARAVLGIAFLLLVGAVEARGDASEIDAAAVTRRALAELERAAESFPEGAGELARIARHLEASLVGEDGGELFAGACGLRPPPEGRRAFVEARRATLEAELLLAAATGPRSRLALTPLVARVLEGIGERLAPAYGFLAEAAVQEARGAGGEPSSGAQLANAERQLDRGRAEAAAGSFPEALQSFRLAWEHSRQVLPAPVAGEAPGLSILAPEEGAVVAASPIDVSGRVRLALRGVVGAEDVEVAVDGLAAAVDRGGYLARGVELREGWNPVVAVARTGSGAWSSACTAVLLDTSPRSRLAPVSGTGQGALIRSVLPEPLAVRVTDAAGAPLPGAQVVFRVIDGDGSLGGGNRSAVVAADGAGLAAVTFTLGGRAGVGVNRVRAISPGVAGEVVFAPAALPGAPDAVQPVSGGDQRGGPGSPLARPFVVVVLDAGANPVPGVQVVFRVVAGDGRLDGGDRHEVTTDDDGRAAATLVLGQELGLDVHRVEASFPGLAREPASFQASAVELGDPAATRVSGVVLDNQGEPVPGVTVGVRGGGPAARTDGVGQFRLGGTPVGDLLLEVDGSTAERAGTWPSLEVEFHALAGVDNRPPRPIYLLPLESGRVVGGGEDVTLTVPGVEGFSLTVPAGSATFPDGSSEGLVSLTAVHADRIPMPPGSGRQPRFVVTVQPAGVRFDPPAPVAFPNADALAPGTILEMFSFDHDLGEFVSIGTGSVSEDATVVRSDPGFGIVEAGWHGVAPPGPSGAAASCAVDLALEEDRIVLGPGQGETLLALGSPGRDVVYSWQVEDPSVVSLEPSGGGLCPDSTTCPTEATGEEAGETRATVTIECTTTGVSESRQVELVVPAIRLAEVTFGGEGFHAVTHDGGELYQPPHWQDNSEPPDGDASDEGDRRFPVSYVRKTKPALDALFRLEPEVLLEGPVLVRARGLAGVEIEATEAMVRIGAVLVEGAGAAVPLPETVEFFDPLELDWEVSFDGQRWTEVGRSDTRVYVTLGEPLVSPLYETVLDVGCRNAAGERGEDEVVAAIWSDFEGPIPGVRRKEMDGFNERDGAEMRYWVNEGDERFKAVSGVCQLLEHMLDPHPEQENVADIGTCAAWARFFLYAIRSLGIGGAEIVEVRYFDGLTRRPELLVKEWTFDEKGTAPPSCPPYTHRRSEADPLDGVPGQGTENPNSIFLNHFIVLYRGGYFDPSYGTGPFSGETEEEAQTAWENASIAGFTTRCQEQGVAVANDPGAQEVTFTPVVVP